MADAYGSGLYRAPHGYEWGKGPRKHLVRRKSSARCGRITEQLLQRLKSQADGNPSAFTSREQQILAEAVGKGAVVR